MPFLLANWKLIAIGLAAVVITLGALAYRHELIEKGKNLVYAEDNAALVKAQAQQMKNDARLVTDQKAYIDHLEQSGAQVKETIRVVQAPCKNDGRGDPRLDDTADWVRDRLATDSLPPGDRRSPEGAVPPARIPAATR